MNHFVMADLHGRFDIYEEAINAIEEYSKDDDYRIFFLGDACDRGKDGYKLIETILNNPKIIYLLGNHEDAFCKSAQAIMTNAHIARLSVKMYLKSDEFLIDSIYDADILFHLSNSGLETLQQWVDYGANFQIIEKLNNLPVKYTFKNIDMCHAGCLKSEWDTSNKISFIDNREHFYENWFNNRILIHGHTPTSFLPNEYASKQNIHVRYNNKIDIDTGAYTTNKYSIYNIENDEFIFLTINLN